MGDEHGELQRQRNRSGAALDYQHPAGLDAARRHRRPARMGEDRRLLARGRQLGGVRQVRRLCSSEPARQSGARRRLVGVWPHHEYRRRTLCRQRLGELPHAGVFAGPAARVLCGRRGETVECAAVRPAAMSPSWSAGDGDAWLHAASLNKGIQQMGIRSAESARIKALRRRALLPALLFMLGAGSAASAASVSAASDVSVAPAPQHQHGGAKPDRDASFGANVKLADHACECCRIALDLAEDGVPVVFWRHVYGDNERDHAVLKLDGKAEPLRGTRDRWRSEAGPHHGPALAIDAQNNYHLVWCSNAPTARGLFYARSHDGAKTLSAPIAIGNAAAQAGYADVLSRGRALYVVWKEFDGESALIRAQQASDGGISWSAPRTVAATRRC